jgi:hypothetical protein
MGNKPTGKTNQRGRKPWREELKIKEVGKLASNILKRALAPDSPLSFEEQAKIATLIFSKYIPKDVTVSQSSVNATIIQITHDAPLILPQATDSVDVTLDAEVG